MFYQLKFFNPANTDATISFQAGILVGAKTAAQVCTGMLWGRFADSDWGGRKSVLTIGLVSCCMFRESTVFETDSLTDTGRHLDDWIRTVQVVHGGRILASLRRRHE